MKKNGNFLGFLIYQLFGKFSLFLRRIKDFQPTKFKFFGEGVFPRVALDLPRGVDESGEDNFAKVIEIVRRDVEVKGFTLNCIAEKNRVRDFV